MQLNSPFIDKKTPPWEKRVKPFPPNIYTYTIYRDNIRIEENIIGWVTALAHARKWKTDLFNNIRRVEILNQWTGEIVTLDEAEKRANVYKAKKAQRAVISGTTF